MRVPLTITLVVAGLGLSLALAPDLDPPAPTPTHSFIDAAQEATQTAATAAMECPWDMPECTMTARQRKAKFDRGGYGRTPAERRVAYGRKLKRQILHQSMSIFYNHHPNGTYHKRAKWRRFVRRDRCVGDTYVTTRDGELRYSRFCARQFYNEPGWSTARKWVREVDNCWGEIALTVIGTKGTSWRWNRGILVAGTGSLCAWKATPPARRR